MAKAKKEKVSEIPTRLDNSFADIVSGIGSTLNPEATPLSQLDPLFYNNRWQLLSNLRQVLSQMYCEHGLVQAIVDIPVDDAFRGGVEIKSSQLSEENITELHAKMDEMGDMTQISQVYKWNRLFGGGGLLILTEQEDYKLALDVNHLDNLEFRAADLWELFYTQQNADYFTAEGKLMPESVKKDFMFDYYGKPVHNSRVVITKGIVPPSFVRPRLRGWGLSVVESLVQSLNQHLKTKNLAYEVLDEFKLDIFKIKGFNQALMTSAGVTKIQRMIALVNQQKNYQNAITMDADDSHEGKQLNFSGISDILKEVRIQIACDMRMPMSKIFGLSATGLNASGEDDIEVYNSMVESTVRFKAKKTCFEVIKLRCQQLFGFIPEDLSIEFKPLRVMSSEQEETIKTNKLTRITLALEKGLISALEAKEAINRDNLLGVKIDTTSENLEVPSVAEGDTDETNKTVNE